MLFRSGKLSCITKHSAEAIEDVISMAEGFEREVVFLGDGVPVHRERLMQNPDFILAPASCNIQRAACVAALGAELVKEGKAIPGKDFAPFYLRKSQAERELEEKNAAGRNKNV